MASKVVVGCLRVHASIVWGWAIFLWSFLQFRVFFVAGSTPAQAQFQPGDPWGGSVSRVALGSTFLHTTPTHSQPCF